MCNSHRFRFLFASIWLPPCERNPAPSSPASAQLGVIGRDVWRGSVSANDGGEKKDERFTVHYIKTAIPLARCTSNSTVLLRISRERFFKIISAGSEASLQASTRNPVPAQCAQFRAVCPDRNRGLASPPAPRPTRGKHFDDHMQLTGHCYWTHLAGPRLFSS
jgi:hypothetical protein